MIIAALTPLSTPKFELTMYCPILFLLINWCTIYLSRNIMNSYWIILSTFSFTMLPSNTITYGERSRVMLMQSCAK